MSDIVKKFIAASGNRCTDDVNQINLPLVVRGVVHRKEMKQCQEIGRDFYFIDTGYLGNFPSPGNLGGKKIWHRIVKNDMQHCSIQPKDNDRWKNLVKQDPRLIWGGWKNFDKKILLVLPNPKACAAYGIDKDIWLNDTVSQIKKHSDLPIEVREKASRSSRNTVYSIYDALDSGVYATVAFNSIAAIESILYGVPAFVAVPCAASPLANTDLSKLSDPYRPSKDLIMAQAFNLAYGQFTEKEIESGKAWNIIHDL